MIDTSNLCKPTPFSDYEFRIGHTSKRNYGKEWWVTLLVYKNARYDMDVLDKYFNGRWERTHKEIKGNLYCGVKLWDNDYKLSIERWDTGSESNMDASKGEASDSFKRACVNFGIGRDLYNLPFIVEFKLNDGEYYETEYKGKKKCNPTINLKQWTWGGDRDKDDNIKVFGIRDANGHVSFKYEGKSSANNNK